MGCELCNLRFSRTKSLHEHYRRKHKIELTDRNDTSTNIASSLERKQSGKKQKHVSRSSEVVQDFIESGDEMDQEQSLNCGLTGSSEGDCNHNEKLSENLSKGDESCTNKNEMILANDKQNGSRWMSQDDSLQKDSCTENKMQPFSESINGVGDAEKSVIQNLRPVALPLIERNPHKKESKQNSSSYKTDGNISCGFDKLANQKEEISSTDSRNAQQTSDLKVKNTRFENHTKTASNRFKDSTKELDIPDFYFIAIIERGPRNSIRGGKYHFKCLYCELKLSWRNTMCQHMKDKHPDILQKGPILNMSHLHLERKYNVIKMSDYLKLEKNVKPGKRIRGIETQDLPGDFPCRTCGKVFHRLRYLRKHEVIHKAEKNLLCSVCVKSFKTLANLNQHMRTHKEREAYKCRQCDFESTINIAIHAHRQLHKDGCVLCDICGRAYNDKSTLTKHKKVHDPNRPFACTYPGCTLRFKSKKLCSAHLKSHTTKAKFDCKICGYAFRHKHHLQRHEIKVHNLTLERKCTYTVLPVDFVDQGVIVTDGNKLTDLTAKPVQSEISLIINESGGVNVDEQFDLESALQNGQLVIATDNSGNTINYEMTDMGMNVSYQTLLAEGDGHQIETQTVLIPQTDGQIMYQQEEVTETICTEVNTIGEPVC